MLSNAFLVDGRKSAPFRALRRESGVEPEAITGAVGEELTPATSFLDDEAFWKSPVRLAAGDWKGVVCAMDR